MYNIQTHCVFIVCNTSLLFMLITIIYSILLLCVISNVISFYALIASSGLFPMWQISTITFCSLIICFAIWSFLFKGRDATTDVILVVIYETILTGMTRLLVFAVDIEDIEELAFLPKKLLIVDCIIVLVRLVWVACLMFLLTELKIS